MDIFGMGGSSEHDSCRVCESVWLDRAVQEARGSWVGMQLEQQWGRDRRYCPLFRTEGQPVWQEEELRQSAAAMPFGLRYHCNAGISGGNPDSYSWCVARNSAP